MGEAVLCDWCDELATRLTSSGWPRTRRVCCDQHSVVLGKQPTDPARSENDWARAYERSYDSVLDEIWRRNQRASSALAG